MAMLKAQLGVLQNLGGSDSANDPSVWDTRHQTLEKIARAQGNTFSDCCRLETNYALSILIDEGISDGAGGVPAGALLDEDGNPILDENGDYIIVD